VADAFSKMMFAPERGYWGYAKDGLGNKLGTGETTPMQCMTRPGVSVKGHRDAYNVLYGDSHAKAYSDPLERIMWHVSRNPLVDYLPMNGTGNMGYLSNQMWTYHWKLWGAGADGPPTVSYLDLSQPGEDDLTKPWAGSSMKVWHDFDVAAGIDVF
ncbi:unnamed protein product, partial [marine sediment metagenome]